MDFERLELEDLVMLLEAEMNESRTILDEKLGLVFYPCSNALFEALEKSMA